MRVYLFVFFVLFFSPGMIVFDQVVLECCERALEEIKSSSALLSDQKNWRAPRPLPSLIMFPKSRDQNSEIAILLSVVEKSYNYVFGDDLLPHSPRGRGYKLQALTSAYI